MHLNRFAGLMLGAATVAIFAPVSHAALLKASGAKTTTTAVTTTTNGQHQIKLTIDPQDISEFQFDLTYDPSVSQFQSLMGINGYIVESFDASTPGIIKDIFGFFEGEGGSETFGAPVPPSTPTDLVELIFLDLDITKDKPFNVVFSSNDFLSGYDPDTGQFVTLSGQQLAGAGSGTIVPGINGNGGGGPSVPLPPAVYMGLIGGAGALIGKARRKRA